MGLNYTIPSITPLDLKLVILHPRSVSALIAVKTGPNKSCCYELISYLEWWDPTKATHKLSSKSHASIAVVKLNSNLIGVTPELANATSLVVVTSNIGMVFNTSDTSGNNT